MSGGDDSVRELLVGRDFAGVHPWSLLESESAARAAGEIDALRDRLAADPRLGVGEIGLDRLKVREIPAAIRTAFERQLALAFALRRPVVLHGATCWGQVVAAVRAASSAAEGFVPPLLFHGFSRSDGLIPDIVALGGFVSVGPAVLNDHAVNYRELVKKIPLDRLLVETDRTEQGAAETPSVREVLAKVAELRGIAAAELERLTDENAARLYPGDFH